MKLQLKVPLLVVIILIFIGIISSGALLYSQRIAAAEQFEHMAMALGGAVQGSLEQGMLTGETKPTQEAIVRIGEEALVNEVALLTPNGVISASNKVSNIGKVINGDEVRKTLQSDEAYSLLRPQNGRDELSVIIPVINKPGCYGCHNFETSILGAIQVSVDTTSLNNQIKQQTTFISILGGLTFIIIGGVLSLTLRRTVLNPLSRLTESAQKLSQGDYSIRAQKGSNDEIGILAKTFNEMANSVEQHNQELELSHHELTNHNIDLEDRMRQKTNGLSALIDIIGIIGKPINLDKLLKDTLCDIIKVVEVEVGVVHLLDEKDDQLIVRVYQGLSSRYIEKITKLKLGERTMGQVVKSGKAIIINNVTDNSDTINITEKRKGLKSYASIPLRSISGVIGTLTLASYFPNKFESEVASLLSGIGDALGIIVENSNAEKKLKVFLADNHLFIRDGIRLILEKVPDMRVVGEASEIMEAIAKIEESVPDIVLIDIKLPGLSGLEAIKQIKLKNPQVKVLILLTDETDRYIREMLKTGASGCVAKTNTSSELISAIRAVNRGELYVQPSIARLLGEEFVNNMRMEEDKIGYDGLTGREREILMYIAEEKKNKDIADILGISVRTVQSHRSHIMDKLGATDRTQLVKFAIRKGLIDL